MLYLEDYLELIENLPMEMRDRFTEMREMDLQVQNATDSLEDRVKNFFKKCGTTPNLKQDWKDEQMDKVKQDYQKALDDADEKVQLANQMYELVERHLRKLDQELSKFKMELEADNAGITEILEKRAQEADKPPPQPAYGHRAEKRKHSALTNHTGTKLYSDRLLSSFATDVVRDSLLGISKSGSSTASSPAMGMFESKSSSFGYNLGQVGAGSSPVITVAASRAIGATVELQQGRRTASLKASYEAVSKSGDLSRELTLGRDLTQKSETKTSGRQKKASARAREQQSVATQPPPLVVDMSTPIEPLDVVVEDGSSSTGWQVDPNEPRYCVCNDVSYGDMVGCDNEDCPIEWFHYGCVGLTQAPRGKWYCPQCLAAMKRRGRK